jgi:hypothetical protein
MNKKLNFGYDMLGKYITIKLNVCLTTTNLEVLECTYKEWLNFYPDCYKGRTRIEGVLPLGSQGQFQNDLQLAITRTKIEKLQEIERRIISDYMDIDRFIPNFDNPFIG